MNRANLFVIAGPTAVGKGTVLRRLHQQYPVLTVSVSVTTRSPRRGEVAGVDYFFVSNDDFNDLIDKGKLLEWAIVHGHHRYGTPASWVDERLQEGLPVILEVDLDGARQVRRSKPDAKMIFIAPPSWEELKNRLLGRGTEDASEQARRLLTAKNELAAQDEFDYVIVNDDVDRTVAELAEVMELN